MLSAVGIVASGGAAARFVFVIGGEDRWGGNGRGGQNDEDARGTTSGATH